MIGFSRPTALFGGSFDPVHEGHLHVARAVQQQLGAQVVFVPARQSPGKAAPIAPASDRLRWLKLAAEPAGFPVWEEELSRQGDSFTVDTLRAAHARGATKENLFLIMGTDAYRGFSQWKEPKEIRRLARLVVVNRPGITLPPGEQPDLALEITAHSASSTRIRAALASGEQSPEFLPLPVRQDLSQLFLKSNSPYVRKK